MEVMDEEPVPEPEPDFAEEHELLTTSEAVSAGKDAHGPEIPNGLGGMDLKRLHLLD